MLDGLNVSVQFASQTKDLHLVEGNKAMPSGLLPSP